MIESIIFNKAFWIQKTTDVANKLANYDNLQKQVNSFKKQLDSLNGEYELSTAYRTFSMRVKNGVISVNGKTLKKGLDVYIDS